MSAVLVIGLDYCGEFTTAVDDLVKTDRAPAVMRVTCSFNFRRAYRYFQSTAAVKSQTTAH